VNDLMIALYIFLLASFAGFELISRVPPLLHTPLMSGSNAVSGIIVVGALAAAGSGLDLAAALLGFTAVVLATINVVGGFVVTDRMLGMFKGKDRSRAKAGRGRP
jgi:NAD(P) transhydrogenase subunit alpha